MRHTLLATALLALFGTHIAPPRAFTPIPLKNGCRPTNECLRRCTEDNRGDYTTCYDICDHCKR